MKTQTLVIALLFLGTQAVLAQKTITGKVADKNGIPLVGTSILVKGTTAAYRFFQLQCFSAGFYGYQPGNGSYA